METYETRYIEDSIEPRYLDDRYNWMTENYLFIIIWWLGRDFRFFCLGTILFFIVIYLVLFSSLH